MKLNVDYVRTILNQEKRFSKSGKTGESHSKCTETTNVKDQCHLSGRFR